MPPDRFSKWAKITPEEYKAYIGFNILMGINSLPSIEDYWKEDEVYHYNPVASKIPRSRFRQQICSLCEQYHSLSTWLT